MLFIPKAMMTTGGRDLLNMDFRIKPRTFSFVGAGTRFKYTRDRLRREKITAQGPLTENVELLVRLTLQKITNYPVYFSQSSGLFVIFQAVKFQSEKFS